MRIREGDPLEIYTDHEGEVIFKKYSPIGELTSFASQYAETLHKTCELSVVIGDRDSVIACAGLPRKEFADRRLSSDIEGILESRSFYAYRQGDKKIPVTDDSDASYYASCVMPIITEGDIAGCVASLVPIDGEPDASRRDTEIKLVQTAATFLGKQLES